MGRHGDARGTGAKTKCFLVDGTYGFDSLQPEQASVHARFKSLPRELEKENSVLMSV